MKGKTLFLLVALVLAVFVLQGCNGPHEGSREAPYSTFTEGPEASGGPLEAGRVVVQSQGPDTERRSSVDGGSG